MFARAFGTLKAWEFEGWKPESLSWKTGCYIHAGLSGPSQTTFSGPEARQFLESICINGFESFTAGSSKHAIMLTDDGLVAAHAAPARRRGPLPDVRRASMGDLPGAEVSVRRAVRRRRDLPPANRRADLAPGPRAGDRGGPAGHRVPALPPDERRRHADRDLPDRHVRHPGLRAARPLADGPEIYDAVVPAGADSVSSGSAGGRTSSTTSRAASPRSRGPSCRRATETRGTPSSPRPTTS